MQEIFFESVHPAAQSFPYIDFNMKNINYFSHFHEEVEIAAVISGAVNIACEGEQFKAEQGDICIFMPGEIHSFSTDEANHLYIIKINCKNSVSGIEFASHAITPHVFQPGNLLNSRITESISSIKKETELKENGYAYMVNSLSNKILCDIIRSGCIIKMTGETKKKHLLSLDLLKKVSDYIDAHYSESIYLADAAEYCNMSLYYFAHLFKEISGTTFYNYLTAFRLEKSLFFLLHTGKNITDIAYECGFSNVRSYNRAFKKVFSLTPTEYVKSMK